MSIIKQEQNGTNVLIECTNKQDFKKLESEWKKLGLRMNREFKVCERGHYVLEYTKEELYNTPKNQDFKEFFELPKHEEIPRIVEELHNPNLNLKLNKDDWKTFVDYHECIQYIVKRKEFNLKHFTKSELISAMYNDLEEEFKEIDHIRNYKMGRNTRVAILDLHQIVRYMWDKTTDKYYDAFFDMKELCEMINAYYHITKPTKAPNKIAYGWTFALDKGYKAFRPYFFACIRNYLQRNNVEFETSDLQKICNLKDIAHEDC